MTTAQPVSERTPLLTGTDNEDAHPVSRVDGAEQESSLERDDAPVKPTVSLVAVVSLSRVN